MRGLFHTARRHGNICNNRRRFTLDGHAGELSGDFGVRFFNEVFDTAAADGRPEELSREIGDLVCLIEDDSVCRAEDVTEAVLLQGHIREQQVVIDDDNVGVECITTGNRDMAA